MEALRFPVSGGFHYTDRPITTELPIAIPYRIATTRAMTPTIIVHFVTCPPDWCAGCCLLTWQDGNLGVEMVPYAGTTKLIAVWRDCLFPA